MLSVPPKAEAAAATTTSVVREVEEGEEEVKNENDLPAEVSLSSNESTCPIQLTSTWLALLSSNAYTLGSIGFIWSSWDLEHWLLPFQVACGIWIVGCCLVLAAIWVPLLLLLRRKDSNKMSEEEQEENKEDMQQLHHTWMLWPIPVICQSLCATLFCLGCCFGFGDEAHVTAQLPIINALFLVGSCCLGLEVLWNLLVLWAARYTRNDSNNNYLRPIQHVAVDTVVAGSFLYAALLGGYGTSSQHIQAAMPGWTLGSIVSGILPARDLFWWYRMSKAHQHR